MAQRPNLCRTKNDIGSAMWRHDEVPIVRYRRCETTDDPPVDMRDRHAASAGRVSVAPCVNDIDGMTRVQRVLPPSKGREKCGQEHVAIHGVSGFSLKAG